MTGSLRHDANLLGGTASGGQIQCPGPRHSKADRSLSLKPSAASPIGYVVHSFAGDDPIECMDYVRAKLGYPPFAPGQGTKPSQRAKKPNGSNGEEPFIEDEWQYAQHEAEQERKRGEPFETAEMRSQDLSGSVVIMGSDIEPEIINWLWKNFLAAGMLHIFAGAPETGKTTLALAYAAAISAGMHWPDETKAAIGKVLIWTNEDHVAKTIIPRLIRMGADMANIGIVKGQRNEDGSKRPFNPSIDMPSLAINEMGGVALLILDPVVAAIPASRDSHKNSETRVGLQPVVDFAEAIGITHFTKGTTGKDPIERITGSLAFGALPRLVMATAKNLADGPPRIFVRVKNNNGPSGGGFGYDLEARPIDYEHPDIVATRVVWLEQLEGTARELLADAEAAEEKSTKIDQAKRLLQDILAKGERLQTEIEEIANRDGISKRTLKRAKAELCVTSKERQRRWFWSL